MYYSALVAGFTSHLIITSINVVVFGKSSVFSNTVITCKSIEILVENAMNKNSLIESIFFTD